MRLPHPFRLILALSLAAIAFTSAALAGGSLSREEFLGAIADPALRQSILARFELAEEGRAVRAGHSAANAGERVPPYEILARATDLPGGAIVLRLEVNRARQITVLSCSESQHFDPDCR